MRIETVLALVTNGRIENVHIQQMQLQVEVAGDVPTDCHLRKIDGKTEITPLLIVRGVLLYILIGIGIGATMHGYVPEGFFEQYLSAENWWSVPLAAVLAVPMYANAAGIVPIVEVFVAKGIPLGTAIAFMMAIIGLSIPEATMLKKVMTWRLIGIFFGVVTLLIILSGYLFNWML